MSSCCLRAQLQLTGGPRERAALAQNRQPQGVLCSILEVWSSLPSPAWPGGLLDGCLYNRHVGELAGQAFMPKCTLAV